MATREQALGFIKEIAPIVQEVCKSRDKWILPSVAIAQAACESNYGTSKAMAAANGLFGFKVGKGKKYGDGWKGKSYSTKTKEFYSGYVTITDNFRAYDSVRDAVVDYMDLLCSLSRYKAAVNETNAQKCITAIKNGGYCTSPTYISTIMNIIRTYGLTEYDSAVKQQASGTLYAAVAGFCNTAAECEKFQKSLQAAGMNTQVWEVKPVKNIS